jgi:ABC-type multidrug transport system ATPase subunit
VTSSDGTAIDRSSPVVALSELSKTYFDGTRALKGLDLELGPGVTGFLGPNGAGKSTLLEMVVLALEPSGGRRLYFGLDDRAAHQRRIRPWIGYLPQEFVSVADLSGFEYLRLCAELRMVGLSRSRLEMRLRALLETVELTNAAHRRTGEYSGGMLRRLGLAQALIHGPHLLVVDEPTAGLDPEERLRFRQIVTDIGERLPVLLSTHIVEDLEATCPRICVLERGELLLRARGRVWTVPEGIEVGSVAVGRRSGATIGGTVVMSTVRPHPAAQATEPTLEEAYAVFLAEHRRGCGGVSAT